MTVMTGAVPGDGSWRQHVPPSPPPPPPSDVSQPRAAHRLATAATPSRSTGDYSILIIIFKIFVVIIIMAFSKSLMLIISFLNYKNIHLTFCTPNLLIRVLYLQCPQKSLFLGRIFNSKRDKSK